MGIRDWLGNKLFNIDKVVDTKVQQRLNRYSNVVDKDLLDYRQRENKIWAIGTSNALLEFYKHTQQPTNFQDRLAFWEWIGGRKTPKLHYPAPQALINHMKSLLFGSDLTIEFVPRDDKEKTKVEELNKRLKKIHKETKLYDLLQNASMLETYSGTVAAKFIIDKEVSDAPIIEMYPAERLEFSTKYNRVVEIIFLDYYKKDSKTYTLKSYYGKGYIDYKLFDDRGKEVHLATIPELSDLERKEFKTKRMLAVYKKNRTTSNEFPDTPYGGSDFEGVIDLFHAIDEIYSSMLLYIRRNRPMITMTEQQLVASADGSRMRVPQEWEQDIVTIKGSGDASQIPSQIYRDSPELKVDAYLESIENIKKSIYYTVGMAYTSVGLEAHSANISGAALVEKEKPTVIVRNNKIKTWIEFLREFTELCLFYEDYMNGKNEQDYDYELLIEFPDYHTESFSERVDEIGKAIRENLLDIEGGVEWLYPELDPEMVKKRVVNIKLENGITLLPDEIEE